MLQRVMIAGMTVTWSDGREMSLVAVIYTD